ncbi:hypothetical protein VTH82DRAFT_1634 [Thermothelomyces myriococcoides]
MLILLHPLRPRPDKTTAPGLALADSRTKAHRCGHGLAAEREMIPLGH